MRKRKKKSLHKFDFNNMPEDLQLIVLFLFMIVGAIITVITYPFRFFKKSQEEEHEEYSFGRYEITEIPKTKFQIIREKTGMTVIELAQKISEIEPSFDAEAMSLTISAIEAGIVRLNITGHMEQLIAQIVRCSVEELVEDTKHEV